MGAQLKKAELKLVTVFFMIFVLCSSGPYGLEDMVSSSGPGMTLLLLLLLPFVWSIPMGLVCSELGSAIPEEAGHYKWVQRGLGEFWGFQAGWWWTLSVVVDTAVYAVLAVDYANAWLNLAPLGRWLLAAAIIAIFTYINIRGIEAVGISDTVFSLIVLLPFVPLVVLGIIHWQGNPFVPFIPEGQTVFESLGLGFAIALWLYSGYESMSTMAGEIRNPQKLIPRGILLAMPFIIAVYFIPTVVGLGSVGEWESWSSSEGISFVELGSRLGGPVLGILILIGALTSNLALFNSYLASGTRAPYVMAEDNLFPKLWSKLHPKFGTPYISILIMAGIQALLVTGSFDQLILIDVFLLMFSYILIFIAAIALRIKEPGLERPFRVPMGTAGLAAISVPPIICAVIALFTNGVEYMIAGALGAVSGPIAYILFKRLYGGLSGSKG
ncbi:MAG: APC family permease [Anaerolineae bacterium]|nr:APC family permease [Anaerolineae bacterium]